MDLTLIIDGLSVLGGAALGAILGYILARRESASERLERETLEFLVHQLFPLTASLSIVCREIDNYERHERDLPRDEGGQVLLTNHLNAAGARCVQAITDFASSGAILIMDYCDSVVGKELRRLFELVQSGTGTVGAFPAYFKKLRVLLQPLDEAKIQLGIRLFVSDLSNGKLKRFWLWDSPHSPEG